MSRLQGAQRRRTVRLGLDILEATPPCSEAVGSRGCPPAPGRGAGFGAASPIQNNYYYNGLNLSRIV